MKQHMWARDALLHWFGSDAMRQQRVETARKLQAWWDTYVHEPGAYPVYTIPDAEEALSELMALAVEEGS